MKKKKSKLVLYDTLKKRVKENGLSIWNGEKNKKYIFKSTGDIKENRPLTYVYIGQNYLTGLFKTRESGIFSGDIKEIDGKRYLLFKVIGENEIKIYEKVPG